MEFGKKVALLLLLSVCSASCFPSRPLNDRPNEAWQAWLLVDSQNQLQNESDRRITPKSVFIAPKLGQRNDSLPDCADGYRADAMGRCIKFVKVDEAAHLDFLLKRLNEMYAAQSSEELEESEESMPTAGPLQVNIPFGQAEDSPSESIPDIAIVIAPTNGHFDDKVNVKRHPNIEGEETIKKHNTEQVEIPPLSEEDYDYEAESDTTTQTEQTTTTTDAITTEIISTLPTTLETTETTESTTTILPEDDGLKALFFLMPTNNTSTEKTNDTIKITPPNNLEKTDETTVTIKEDMSDEPYHEVEDISSFINPADHQQSSLGFPDDKPVKFPDIADPPKKEESTFLADNIRDYYSNPEHHKPHSGELTADQIQDIYRQYLHRPAAYVDRPQVPHERIYNHRNRDRNENLWNLTPTLRDESIQKPSVLRFGRYPGAYYPQGLYNPKHLSPHHEVQYYGEQPEDYSNIYGRKRRRGNLR